MIRGIGQQNIFVADEDYQKFLDILQKYHREIEYEIYAYCLMSNHVHLLIKEGKEPLSNTMKRIGTSYVYWFNWQYNRKGHLFQDRFKSEPVEDDTYFLTVLRYIHQNPLKAGLTQNIDSYKWSSYNEYNGKVRMVNVDFVLAMIHEDKDKAMKSFRKFNLEANDDECLEITEPARTLSDKELKEIVLKKYKIDISHLQFEEPKKRLEVLKFLKGLEGTSLRQLSRLTGISVNRIFRV